MKMRKWNGRKVRAQNFEAEPNFAETEGNSAFAFPQHEPVAKFASTFVRLKNFVDLLRRGEQIDATVPMRAERHRTALKIEMEGKDVLVADLLQLIDGRKDDFQRNRIGLDEREDRRIGRRKFSRRNFVSPRVPVGQTLVERRRLFGQILDQHSQQFVRIGMDAEDLPVGLAEAFVLADVLTVNVDRMDLRVRMKMFDQIDSQAARGDEDDLSRQGNGFLQVLTALVVLREENPLVNLRMRLAREAKLKLTKIVFALVEINEQTSHFLNDVEDKTPLISSSSLFSSPVVENEEQKKAQNTRFSKTTNNIENSVERRLPTANFLRVRRWR